MITLIELLLHALATHVVLVTYHAYLWDHHLRILIVTNVDMTTKLVGRVLVLIHDLLADDHVTFILIEIISLSGEHGLLLIIRIVVTVRFYIGDVQAFSRSLMRLNY